MISLAAGVMGGLFFLWIAGARVLSPTEYGWVMQSDWRIHFLGWHFFRREGWAWPPGRLEGYFHAPDGTAIGFTDSIPLAAFALKPFSPLLPDVFQYLGLWLLVCFILQGVMAARLVGLWTERAGLRLLGAALFVLMPTLLIRVGHPALCAHFLILWALHLYFTSERRARGSAAQHAALGLTAGLVHPYLAVMSTAVAGATTIRTRSVAPAGLCAVAVLVGWWASGLFTATGADQLATEGLGVYSMNLLAPLTPSGWSTLLPEAPVATTGQTYEGFQYFGAGTLLLMAAACVAWVARRGRVAVVPLGPLLAVAAACAVYALSPRVTLGASVLADFSSPALEELAIFRATGRFFWPMAYLALMLAIASVTRRLPHRAAVAVLAAAVAVQAVDLRAAHAERRRTSRSEAFHAHRLPLQSPVWDHALPHYRHLVMINPPQCGEAPLSFEWPAFVAGLHRLRINAGEVARPDLDKARAYCQTLHEQTRRGAVRDDTVYVVHPRFVEPLQQAARVPFGCTTVDGLAVCVTGATRHLWNGTAFSGSGPQ